MLEYVKVINLITAKFRDHFKCSLSEKLNKCRTRNQHIATYSDCIVFYLQQLNTPSRSLEEECEKWKYLNNMITIIHNKMLNLARQTRANIDAAVYEKLETNNVKHKRMDANSVNSDLLAYWNLQIANARIMNQGANMLIGINALAAVRSTVNKT